MFWEKEGEDRGDVIGGCNCFEMHDIYDESFSYQLHRQIQAKYSAGEITRCTGDRRAWSEDHAVSAYGNEPTLATVYDAASSMCQRGQSVQFPEHIVECLQFPCLPHQAQFATYTGT